MTRRAIVFLPLVLLCLAVAIFTGFRAGPRTGTVIGSVAINGQPLESGSVLVASDVLSWATVGIVQDGQFVVDDIPPGPIRVGVTGDGVPWQYEDPSSSGLQFDVHRGHQKLPLNLTDD